MSLQAPEKVEAEAGPGAERVSSTMSATGVEIRNTRHLIYGMQLLQKEINTDLAVFGPVLEVQKDAATLQTSTFLLKFCT